MNLCTNSLVCSSTFNTPPFFLFLFLLSTIDKLYGCHFQYFLSHIEKLFSNSSSQYFPHSNYLFFWFSSFRIYSMNLCRSSWNSLTCLLAGMACAVSGKSFVNNQKNERMSPWTNGKWNGAAQRTWEELENIRSRKLLFTHKIQFKWIVSLGICFLLPFTSFQIQCFDAAIPFSWWYSMNYVAELDVGCKKRTKTKGEKFLFDGRGWDRLSLSLLTAILPIVMNFQFWNWFLI